MLHEPLPTTPAPTRSSDEIERNKPLSNRIHGHLQGFLLHLLWLSFGDRFDFSSEVSLDTQPPTTPDICVFPARPLDLKQTAARETETPLTVVEILSPCQSVNELMHKAWDIYFPAGVGSMWMVVPELKIIYLILPDDTVLTFGHGTLTDPTTGITLDVDQVFAKLR